MKRLRRIPWFRLLGWSIFIHVILLAASIVEVFIYATANPGLDQSLYEDHAQTSGPYIAIGLGFILIFFAARAIAKRQPAIKFLIGLLLPAFYVILDIALLVATATDVTNREWLFGLSFLTKFLAGVLGASSLRTHRA